MREIGRLADLGERGEVVSDLVGELAGVDEECRPALVRNDCESQRQRRVAHVGAADVERPGNGVGIGDHQCVGAQLDQFRTDACELLIGAFAGEARVVQRHRAERCGGAIGPDCIERIGLDRDQRRADGGAGLAQTLHALRRVQPGVVAEPVVGGEIAVDPAGGWCLDDMLDGEQGAVDLLARLQGVAAVDEQHRAFHHHDGGTGGAGETAEPGEPLLACRQVFVLVAVGARQDEPGQPAACELRAQRGDARSAFGTPGAILERLVVSFEHGGNLWACLQHGNGIAGRTSTRGGCGYRMRLDGRVRTSVVQPPSDTRSASTNPRAR